MPSIESMDHMSYEDIQKSNQLINSWNNKKRICACCKKNKLQSRTEREKNCCLECGLINFIKDKDDEINRLKELLNK